MISDQSYHAQRKSSLNRHWRPIFLFNLYSIFSTGNVQSVKAE